MSDNGFFMKSADQVSHFDNPLVESHAASMDKASLGRGNRIFRALPSQNIPLSRSLNYLLPQKFFSVNEIISSQNSGYVLVGGQNGSISICNSMIQVTPIKTLQFFSHDIEKKQSNYL